MGKFCVCMHVCVHTHMFVHISILHLSVCAFVRADVREDGLGIGFCKGGLILTSPGPLLPFQSSSGFLFLHGFEQTVAKSKQRNQQLLS